MFEAGWDKRSRITSEAMILQEGIRGTGDLLHQFLREIESLTGVKLPIVLEATGHYHTPVVQYFEDRNYLLIIVNPLISYRAKS